MNDYKRNRWVIIDKMFLENFFIAGLIEFSYVGAGVIDGIVVSKMMPGDAMASFGLAQPFFSLVAIFFGLFATGMQTMTSHELGNGNLKECNRIFCATVYIATAFSLISMFLALMFPHQIAFLLSGNGSGKALQEGAAAYIRGLAFGIPAIILNNVIAPSIQMDSGRRLVYISVIVDFVSDVIFDLIAVKLGLGLFGIGLATTIGRYIKLTVLFSHFSTKNHLLHFVPFKTSFKEFKHLLSMGTEKAWRRLGNVIRPVFVNQLILFYGGAMAMSAMSVRGNICDITEVLAVGLADTVGLLTGIYYGEKNAEAERALGKTAHFTCYFFCGIASILLFIFSGPIAAFYMGKGTKVAAMTRFAILGIVVQCPLQALIRARITYLQRILKNKNMKRLILVNTVVFPILSALILGLLFGVYGILWCYTVGDLSTLIAVWLYYVFKCKKPVPDAYDYLNLPEDFHVNPGDIISLDIRDMDDVSLVSEQIGLFCNGHKIPSEIGNRASVCFEEVASNTIKCGFPLSKDWDPLIDLRLIISDNKLIMRLQDNCPKYDIAARIKKIQAEEKAEQLTKSGTRIIAGLADDVDYAFCYETNLLFMKFDL